MFCISSRGLAAGLCAVWVLSCACARHSRAQGIVLAVDGPQRTVTISQRAIPGYMDAMAMPFHAVPSELLDQLAPGSRIEFQLKVGRGSSTVRHIRVQRTSIADVPLPKAEGQLAIGDSVPDFSLTDRAGRSVKISDFRRRLIAVDFTYTRCPMPDVCPRLSANFARLQKRFGRRGLLGRRRDDYALFVHGPRRSGGAPARRGGRVVIHLAAVDRSGADVPGRSLITAWERTSG